MIAEVLNQLNVVRRSFAKRKFAQSSDSRNLCQF